jgi:hypothetical protein
MSVAAGGETGHFDSVDAWELIGNSSASRVGSMSPHI